MEIEPVQGGIAGALIILAFFGSIALLVWVSNKGESEKRKLKHELDLQRGQHENAVRLKALESGQPLPDADLALAAVERARVRAACAVGTLVPIVTAGAAVIGTAVVLQKVLPQDQLPVLCVIWGCAGLAILVTAVTSLSAVAGRRSSKKPPVEAVARMLSDRSPKLERVGSSQ